MAFPSHLSMVPSSLGDFRCSQALTECRRPRKSRDRIIQCKRRFQKPFLQNFLLPLSSLYVSTLRAHTSESREVTASVTERFFQTESSCEVFEGLNGSDTPVGICETRSLRPAISIDEAVVTLYSAISELEAHSPSSGSGTLRFQVPLPPDLNALQWLQSQRPIPFLRPRSYFSPRGARETGTGGIINESARDFLKLDDSGVGGVAGVGAAVLFTGSKPFSSDDWKAIKRFLSKDHPIIRAYGALRFDPKMKPSEEWRPFGSFYFFIPQIELCECDGCSLLAVTLAWDTAMKWPFIKALQNALAALQMVSTRICPDNEGLHVPQVLQKEHLPDEPAWHDGVDRAVESLAPLGKQDSHRDQKVMQTTSTVDRTSLFKVVMARRTKLEMNDHLDPISLLACLQTKNPSAYQFTLQVPDGSTFIGCSPERLFARDGLLVASEAVAGTRARGSTGPEDLKLGLDLMESTKDHDEFAIVREKIMQRMEMVCKVVKTEGAKSLLKSARVQHLYARFNGELHSEAGEFDILSALHPTPAVCGHPQELAREAISRSEEFDRGLYAGPVGWFGGNGAEFAVGIRSSLIRPGPEPYDGRLPNGYHADLSHFLVGEESSRLGSGNGARLRYRPTTPRRTESWDSGTLAAQKRTCMFLYAGVGIIKGSNSTSEWRELELKISQFETLLENRQGLEKIVNINALWAKLIVDECCRLGITYFCVAPGSRSTPIAAAAAANPRVICVSCIDERSMAFHAVGYGQGANKPAAVVTSSGTAVANLLPAVVEASQNFVPLVVLTADRPAELYDSGANQSIDQGKIFAAFVRYHANLPAADEKVPAKVVLTTVDAAVNRAMAAPSGPVHINCAFREPLAGSPEAWNIECLNGLERWTATSLPYTQYIYSKTILGGLHPSFVAELEGVGQLIRSAQKGLLVVGGLSAAEETWAVALLAQHLGWPVVPDVISGLRIGEALCSAGEKKVNIIHNFDQILLSEDVSNSSKPDVVLQIGSRLTSKRLSQFLEASNLRAYILVEEHPFRHDPAHIITHRIQSCTADFSCTLIRVTQSRPPTPFCSQLKLLSEVVERKVHLMLQREPSLTEPFVAHYLMSCLPAGCALFLGNSLPIRDVNMYAHGKVQALQSAKDDDERWDQAVPHLGARVGANRGASGIDGIVSTAVGFAVGSKRRVTVLLGDLSFLHDTNGLTLLSNRTGQPPVTIVVVNNGGGGIFSLLPVVETMSKESFSALFSTPHTVDLKKLCEAHRVDHWLVQTKTDLKWALQTIHGSTLHWVIEVESKIEDNADFHRFLNFSIGQAVTQAFHVLSKYTLEVGHPLDNELKVSEAKYSSHSFSLVAPPTTDRENSSALTVRQGFLLHITLSKGSSGVGEIVPLKGLHKETLLDVEEQLRVIVQKMKDRVLTWTLPLLDGSFSSWLSEVLGVKENTLFPSVRNGIEMAVLGALAATQGGSILSLLSGAIEPRHKENNSAIFRHGSNGTVRVCGLLDSKGSPEDTADAAAQLVKEGFGTLKLKVGRRASHMEDAAMVKHVRDRVGPSIHLRADANRKWSYEAAKDFSEAVQSCGIEYIEEPVSNPMDILRFCKVTGIPVALDETLDEEQGNIEERLQTYASQGIAAMVVKPGCVGGFEKAWQIAQWAQVRGILVVISSAFESEISLAAYSQFAAFVDDQVNGKMKYLAKSSGYHNRRNYWKSGIPEVAHGLGTYKWLSAVNPPLPIKPNGNSIAICSRDSADFLQHVSNLKAHSPGLPGDQVSSSHVKIDCWSGNFLFHVMDLTHVQSKALGTPTVIFLHGFMGTGQDWLLIMNALSVTFRCVAVDLPGHGQTKVLEREGRNKIPMAPAPLANVQGAWSMEGLGAALAELLTKLEGGKKVILVGYSMGARIALYMALKHSDKVSGAVIVSGSPGLDNATAQKAKTAQDDEVATSLRGSGFQPFVDWWYRQPLWNSLRAYPDFEDVKKTRWQRQNPRLLAKAVASFSSGRQPSLWKDLADCRVPLLLVAGELDTKFVGIAQKMVKASESFDHEFAPLNPQGLEGIPRATEETLRSVTEVGADAGSEGHSDTREMKARQTEHDDLPPHAAKSGEKTRPGPEGYRSFPQYLEIENTGHAVHIESPLKLVKAIREFALSARGTVDHRTE